MLIGSVAVGDGYRLAGHSMSRFDVALAALGIALALVLPHRVWRWARLGVTAVHESGHAVAALLVGRKVTAIHLRSDSSGVTVHYGPGGWLRRAVTAAAGYPAPGLVAITGALLLEHRLVRVWLVALLVLGVVNVVLWIRNLFGWFVMVGWIGAVGWLIVRGTTGVDGLVGAMAVWFLAIGGLRAALEVPRAPATSDAADLSKLLHLPNVVCRFGFAVAAGASLVAVALVLRTIFH
jgi:hypothetical protein